MQDLVGAEAQRGERGARRAGPAGGRSSGASAWSSAPRWRSVPSTSSCRNARSRGGRAPRRRGRPGARRAVGAAALDVDEDAEGEPAGGGGHRRVSRSRAPGARRAPAAKAAARHRRGGSRAAPRGARSARPGPQPTTRPSPIGDHDLPGRRPRRERPRRARAGSSGRARASVVTVPGQGWKPRTRRAMASAGSVQSMRPSSFLRMRGEGGARRGPGARASACPRARPSSVSSRSAAPRRASRASSSGVVSSAPMGVARESSVGPVSRPSSISIVVTPVSRLAVHDRPVDRAPPRGSAAAASAWTLTVPRGGMSMTRRGQDLAVGDDDLQLGGERAQRLLRLRRRGCGGGWSTAQAARLGHRLHRRRLRGPARVPSRGRAA